MEQVFTLNELVEHDPLAQKKGTRWLREKINEGRLKAFNTGTDKKPRYVVNKSDWAEFLEVIKQPAGGSDPNPAS